jgi:hypothetical protein
LRGLLCRIVHEPDRFVGGNGARQDAPWDE